MTLPPRANTDAADLNMPPSAYKLYAYSYLRYGVDQARIAVLDGLLGAAGFVSGSAVDYPCALRGRNDSYASQALGTNATL